MANIELFVGIHENKNIWQEEEAIGPPAELSTTKTSGPNPSLDRQTGKKRDKKYKDGELSINHHSDQQIWSKTHSQKEINHIVQQFFKIYEKIMINNKHFTFSQMVVDGHKTVTELVKEDNLDFS